MKDSMVVPRLSSFAQSCCDDSFVDCERALVDLDQCREITE